MITEIVLKRSLSKYRLKKAGICIAAYAFATFLIVPYLAPILGREKIKDSAIIEAHTFFTKLLNRNYVTPQLQTTLKITAASFRKQYPEIKLIYLDANFPFFDGFPLLPHLSHNDGKKIDISFIYENNDHVPINKKPSVSGYGVFEAPTPQEHDQTKVCKQKGYQQYDYNRYLTFGTINNSLVFSEKATKELLLTIVQQKQIGKVFIEPHLKSRLGVQHSKIRFHGCQAVRHDDHIHIQLK